MLGAHLKKPPTMGRRFAFNLETAVGLARVSCPGVRHVVSTKAWVHRELQRGNKPAIAVFSLPRDCVLTGCAQTSALSESISNGYETFLSGPRALVLLV
jgi:hypothetical protein